MKKSYFLIFYLLVTTYFYGQTSDTSELDKGNSFAKIQEIENFRMYPNPVTNGVIRINTLDNAQKTIQIFDILGKKVFSKLIINEELNISKLNSGVYILKVFENGKTATRKLVIK
jgi:hypothetical protein